MEIDEVLVKKCSSERDAVTLSEWSEEPPSVFIKFTGLGPDRTVCYDKDSLSTWLTEENNLYAKWQKRADNPKLQDTGYGGEPNIDFPYYKLYSDREEFLAVNELANVLAKGKNKYYAVAKYAGSERIGNLEGIIGESKLHGQLPPIPTYKIISLEKLLDKPVLPVRQSPKKSELPKGPVHIFDDGKKILSYVDLHQSFIPLLSQESGICPLIGKEIKFAKKLGEGSYGTVYEIKFEGSGKKRYVVKVRNMIDEDIDFHEVKFSGISLEEYLDQETNIDVNVGVKANGGDPNRELIEGDVLVLPYYLADCPFEEHKYTLNDGSGKQYTTPLGYICNSEAYSEFFLSLLVGELYRTGVSINFIDTFAFATCAAEKKQYTFMEKLDGDLRRHECIEKLSKNITFSHYKKYDNKTRDQMLIEQGFTEQEIKEYAENYDKCEKEISPEDIIPIIIQIMHAILCYQQKYKICHGDLHLGNILYQNTENAIWQGSTLTDFTHFEYRLSGKSLYIPATRVIVKIADWGFGAKYEYPFISTSNVITSRFEPNFYNTSYDAVMVLKEIYEIAKQPIYLEGLEKYLGRKQDYQPQYKTRPLLPLLKTTFAKTTPWDILNDTEITGKYTVKPPAGSKVILLGEI